MYEKRTHSQVLTCHETVHWHAVFTSGRSGPREHHRRRREMFVPLIHPPGHGQADFGEARAVIGGVARKGRVPVSGVTRNCKLAMYGVS